MVTEASLVDVDRLALISRYGVGLDTIDLDACTRAGIAVTVTPNGVRRPMASAALALILTLGHRLVERQVALSDGRWSDGRFGVVGTGLTGKTLGLVGFGNIGRELARLIEPFDMRLLVSSPRLTQSDAARAGVASVSIDALLRDSDFVVLVCPLTPETYHLIDDRRLALMKSSAFLINISRGAVVDENALVEALREQRISGAGLDVFETEPLPKDSQLLTLANAICTPHALGYTDELLHGCLAEACEAIQALAQGQTPPNVANPAVLENPTFRKKFTALSESAATDRHPPSPAQ
jgi:D-3-phosphoglycerate dehydrogenase